MCKIWRFTQAEGLVSFALFVDRIFEKIIGKFSKKEMG
jgi:hypothetical protein